MIDPETGQLVSNRTASITLRLSSLLDIGMPKAIADSSSKPWLVEFEDILGTAYKFKVASSNPDRSIGHVTCTLENYTE